jgi:threonine/homoserine/homoserine lactone efflux protein
VCGTYSVVRVIPIGHVLAFSLVAFVIIVIPGPSVLFVISRAMCLGRRAALTTVLGNATGQYAQVIAVAVGIGAVVERSVLVFTAVKVCGAIYLIILGLRAIRHRGAMARVLDAVTAPRTGIRIFGDGFVVGLSNPKSVIFFATILPQFVNRSSGHVSAQLLVLGLVWILIALISDSAWGLAASTARLWLARSPRRLERIGGTGGLVMIGLGVGVALTGRKD